MNVRCPHFAPKRNAFLGAAHRDRVAISPIEQGRAAPSTPFRDRTDR